MRVILGSIVRLAVPALILALGIGAYYSLSRNSEEAKKPRAEERKIRTRVTELAAGDYPVTVTAQGVVQSHNEITLSAQVSGQIQFLSPNFEIGSHFSKGDVLIELDDRDYAAALKSAEAAHLRAQSAHKLAQLDHERRLSGVEQGSVSVFTQAEVDQAAASLTQAEADLNAAEAALDQAKLDLERTKILAPFDGRVREKLVGLGQSLSPGAPAAVIFAVDYAEVRLPISARDRRYLELPELEGAPPVPVELRDAIEPDLDITWEARIVRTEGTLDAGSLELVAVARIDDPFGLKSGKPPVRIGQPVTGLIRGETLTDVVAIPRPAVRELDQIILIDKSDLRLSKVAIEPVWSDADYVIVPHSDVFDGAFLATTHIVYAPEGATVEIIPALDGSLPIPSGSKETGA